jgi:MoxR-like ATPase
MADEVTPDAVIARVLQTVGLPQIAARPVPTVPGPPQQGAPQAPQFNAQGTANPQGTVNPQGNGAPIATAETMSRPQ